LDMAQLSSSSKFTREELSTAIKDYFTRNPEMYQRLLSMDSRDLDTNNPLGKLLAEFRDRGKQREEGIVANPDRLMASAAPSQPQIQNQQTYYVSRSGTIYVDGRDVGEGQRIQFRVESATRPGTYDLVAELPRNAQGLVQFPATGTGYERYGTVDAGGYDENERENVGQGDHFLRPETAAALFGLTRVLHDDSRVTMSLGDMSSSNGSDPWQRGGPGHHSGHGHLTNRTGEDLDFRYVDRNGRAFRDNEATTDPRFSAENNQTIYDTARRFGFTINYQGTGSNLGGVTRDSDHNDHGHLGFDRNNARITQGRPPLRGRD
jgi:hypothetical protein